MAPLVQSFAPVIAPGCHTLILGSMPGERSLAVAEYYGHPRNAFWPIMGQLFGFSVALSYGERLGKLNDAGIALWDVMASCEREGSLDTAIVAGSITPAAIPELLEKYPGIQRIVLNGTAAATVFRKHIAPKLAAANLRCTVLHAPSTSPAHASMRQEEKLRVWESLLQTPLPMGQRNG
jgi:double-stranded uracil-DNA glycosylase